MAWEGAWRMTNSEFIRNSSDFTLASLLIMPRTDKYGWVTSDNKKFAVFEQARLHEIGWLKMEAGQIKK